MPFKDSAKEIALDAVGAVYDKMSLHTGFPATLLNEISGGDPQYGRNAVTYNNASGDEKTISNQPTFDVPGDNTTVASAGFCDLLEGGDIGADHDVPDETLTNQGTYTVTSARLRILDPEV